MPSSNFEFLAAVHIIALKERLDLCGEGTFSGHKGQTVLVTHLYLSTKDISKTVCPVSVSDVLNKPG